MRLGVAGGEPVDQPRRVKPEVVVEGHADRDRRVGRNVAIGLGLVDHDPGGFVAKTAHVIMHGVAVLESLGVFQVEPEAEVSMTVSVVLNRVPDSIESQRGCRPGCLARRSSAWASGLFASPSSSSRVPSSARNCVNPGASSCGVKPVYSGATSLTASDFKAGGGTTLTATSRIDVESSPAATEKRNG